MFILLIILQMQMPHVCSVSDKSIALKHALSFDFLNFTMIKNDIPELQILKFFFQLIKFYR